MDNNLKIKHLRQLSDYRTTIIKKPPLRNLFLELTTQCNENCIHCGSNCGKAKNNELTTEQYRAFLKKVKDDFDIRSIMLDITGGEPLLRKDFFDIMSYAHKLGYIWGMTSNGTLIDDSIAKQLQHCGMRTIAISIDGLPETHDKLRRRNGAYEAAMNGIKALKKNGSFENVQVTTVVNHENINQLDDLFCIMKQVNIDSWRVINVEPIGRAKDNSDLRLSNVEYKRMFDFIKENRNKGYPITYGCSHYLGLDYEREVREWYYLCNAGVYTASITSEGDICACLDIERRTELTQGNILKDDFKYIWENKFEVFRTNLSSRNKECEKCSECDFCHGGAFHTWDFEKNEPRICFKNILF